MKNFGLSTLILGGLAASVLGLAGPAVADTGIDASTAISSSDTGAPLLRNSFEARPTTYASPATTWVPWASGVTVSGVDTQPWSSVSGVNQDS